MVLTILKIKYIDTIIIMIAYKCLLFTIENNASKCPNP